MGTDLATQPASNAMEVYGRIDDPLQFAKMFADSAASMLGADLRQGPAIALHAMCQGITIPDFARRNHWIEGRPSMRSDAMLAEFRMNHRGSHRVIIESPDKIEIEFIDRDGNVYPRTLTWEECQQEPWPWKDKHNHDKGLKDNWATPLGRQAMMFARLVSRSLRSICPELVAGVYTPEEILESVVGDNQVPAPGRQRPTVEEIAASAASDGGSPVEGEVVSVEVTSASPASQPEADSEPAESASVEPNSEAGSATKSQVDCIKRLFDECNLTPEKRSEVLARRGASVERNLSVNDAAELIDKLRSLKTQRMQAAAGE